MMCAVLLFDTESPPAGRQLGRVAAGVCVSSDTICLPEFYLPACQRGNVPNERRNGNESPVRGLHGQTQM